MLLLCYLQVEIGPDLSKPTNDHSIITHALSLAKQWRRRCESLNSSWTCISPRNPHTRSNIAHHTPALNHRHCTFVRSSCVQRSDPAPAGACRPDFTVLHRPSTDRLVVHIDVICKFHIDVCLAISRYASLFSPFFIITWSAIERLTICTRSHGAHASWYGKFLTTSSLWW